jgi:hypothetical protein
MKKKVLMLVLLFSLPHMLCIADAVTLSHNSSNIKNGYRVAFADSADGRSRVVEFRASEPLIYAQDAMDTPDLSLAAIRQQGLPIHLPAGPVSSAAGWDGWSNINSGIGRHHYKITALKKIAGRTCLEVTYKVSIVPGKEDGTNSKEEIQAAGKFLFDANNGVVVVNTFEYAVGGTRCSYAAVLQD